MINGGGLLQAHALRELHLLLRQRELEVDGVLRVVPGEQLVPSGRAASAPPTALAPIYFSKPPSLSQPT